MRLRDVEILRTISELQAEGMRAVGRKLIETRLNQNFRTRTIHNLAVEGFLQGDEEIGWALTQKGRAELERRGI